MDFSEIYIEMCILHFMQIADLIKQARRDAGNTQLEMARRAGTAQPAVSAY